MNFFGAGTYYNSALDIQYTTQERESTAFYIDGTYEISDPDFHICRIPTYLGPKRFPPLAVRHCRQPSR